MYFLLFLGDGFCIWIMKTTCQIPWGSQENLATRLPVEHSGVQIPAVTKNWSLFQEAQTELQTPGWTFCGSNPSSGKKIITFPRGPDRTSEPRLKVLGFKSQQWQKNYHFSKRPRPNFRTPAESSGVQIPAVAKKLSLFQEPQTEIQNHSVSSSRGTGALQLIAKCPGRWGWPLSHLVSELRMSGVVPPPHLYVFVERIRTSWRLLLKI